MKRVCQCSNISCNSGRVNTSVSHIQSVKCILCTEKKYKVQILHTKSIMCKPLEEFTRGGCSAQYISHYLLLWTSEQGLERSLHRMESILLSAYFILESRHTHGTHARRRRSGKSGGKRCRLLTLSIPVQMYYKYLYNKY